MRSPFFPAPRLLARYAGDQRGVVTIMVVAMLGVLFGLGALVIDAGRLYNLHSQLQTYADHVALAAAAELDGEDGAIDRAVLAALGDDANPPLVRDFQNFDSDAGDAELALEQLIFLETLGEDPPASDLTTRPADDVTLCGVEPGGLSTCTEEHDNRARFVEVTVEPRDVTFFLLPVLRAFGVAEAAAAGNTQTQAIAGFTREVCNFPPMMMCNPYEDATNNSFTPEIGQQIRLRSLSPGSGLAPGNFALLDTLDEDGPPECSGPPQSPQRIACVLAAVEPQTRCVSATINTRPGQATPIYHGINARFDIWGQGQVSNLRNNFNFRPSANVTKGLRWTGASVNQCKYGNHDPDDTLTAPLPRDPCFGGDGDANTCDEQKFGDGVSQTAMEDYWLTNHPGYPGGYPGFGTRYDMYRYEIDENIVSNRASDDGENGSRLCDGTDCPRCSPYEGVDNPHRDRRTMIVAVVNCLEHGVTGSEDDVPVIAFAEFFITEPVQPPGSTGNSADLFIEMLGVAEPGGDDGVLHEFPQLYR